MSKKQLGVASDGASGSFRSPGWMRRLRAQPGFRTALVAFCLTVVLGVGGSAAYAYWSLRADATLTVATARPALPKVPAPTCNDRSWFTTVGWTAPAGVPSDAFYIVRISTSKGAVDYAFPPEDTGFVPAYLRLNGQTLYSWMGAKTADVTVSTGFLTAGAVAPGVVDRATQVLDPSDPSTPTKLRSNSGEIPWFTC